MKYLKLHNQSHEGETANHLTYQDCVLQCISGVLRNDVDASRGRMAVKHGLLEQVAHVLTVEGDLRSSVTVSCDVLNNLVKIYPASVPKIRDLGIEQLVNDALARFPEEDSNEIYNEKPLPQSC